MNCMIAVGKPVACTPEGNSAKAFIHIIIPNGLKNNIIFVLQTIARKSSQTVSLVVKPAGHQTCRIFLYRFIILVIGNRARTGIIRYLRKEIEMVICVAYGRRRIIVGDREQISRQLIIAVSRHKMSSLFINRPGL